MAFDPMMALGVVGSLFGGGGGGYQLPPGAKFLLREGKQGYKSTFGNPYTPEFQGINSQLQGLFGDQANSMIQNLLASGGGAALGLGTGGNAGVTGDFLKNIGSNVLAGRQNINNQVLQQAVGQQRQDRQMYAGMIGQGGGMAQAQAQGGMGGLGSMLQQLAFARAYQAALNRPQGTPGINPNPIQPLQAQPALTPDMAAALQRLLGIADDQF